MAQLAIIKQMSRQVLHGSAGDTKQMSSRCHGAQLSIIKQMNRQVSRGSDGHSQADEQAGVARLSFRLSSR